MRLLKRLAIARLHARLPTWVRVVVAAAAVVLGVVIVIRPTTALDVLAWLIGGGMALTGLLELTGREGESHRPRWRRRHPASRRRHPRGHRGLRARPHVGRAHRRRGLRSIGGHLRCARTVLARHHPARDGRRVRRAAHHERRRRSLDQASTPPRRSSRRAYGRRRAAAPTLGAHGRRDRVGRPRRHDDDRDGAAARRLDRRRRLLRGAARPARRARAPRACRALRGRHPGERP
ncbi:MAG: hypothetical protein K0S49_1398, partial [Microbacterium sp.]|nr:hypothetical protein [Microbacterium sp.]